jgi:glycosyltransferase involved in cell wall biosynthesis
MRNVDGRSSPLNSPTSKAGGLHLIVDGVVYGFQKHGGINTYFNEILSRLSKRRDLAITVLLPYHSQGRLPRMGVQVWREPLPAATGWSWKLDVVAEPLLRRANELVTKLRWQRERARRRWPCVFQSTYFTMSAEPMPQVAGAYDLNHEIFPERYQGAWGTSLRRQYRVCLEQAARIIAISQTTKQDVMRFYGLPSERIDVVYPAVNGSVFRPEHPDRIQAALHARLGGCQPYILHVGGRASYKNFGGLLEGFARSAVRKQLHLVVAGKPWRETERKQMVRLGLESRIRLVVNPSDLLLAALYQGAAAFVYPSYYEGFGIPLLEAMACGTLVLASDIPVFHEVAGGAPVYFDPSQPAAIARALETPLTDTMRRECVARGFEQVAKYSWDRCAEQTYDVYRKTLASQDC